VALLERPVRSGPAADTAPDTPARIGQPRGLAARALQRGAGCTQQRASALLGVSRRQIGRETDAAPVTVPSVVQGARTWLAETVGRGSTAEERDAATAWLQAASRDEHQSAQVPASRRSAAHRHGAVRRPSGNGAHRHGSATATAPHPPPPLIQIDALRRQQQRILHRSALIDYVLTAETRGGGPLTMGDALARCSPT
jgi:hypothetical protein